MKKTVRFLCLILALSLLLPTLSGCGTPDTVVPDSENYVLQGSPLPASDKDEMKEISRNDRFILYANLKQGTVSVRDRKNGQTWYSNPVDQSEDGIASGFNKNALQSTISVVYKTEQSVEMTTASFMNSVRKDGLSYYLPEDGSVIFVYNFPKEEFYIPVRFFITEDHFSASVLSQYVYEYGTNSIQSVDVLPFFGAGKADDEGFLLVPDGSGALIYYSNNRLTASTYNKTLYGVDSGTIEKIFGGKATNAASIVSENQYMPVFGNSRNDQGFLAVITGNAARGAIKANVAKKYTMYNTVWSSYAYRTTGTVRQTQKDGSDLAVNISEKNQELWDDYEVSYYFLDRFENTYADMAATYRDYLVKTYGMVTSPVNGDQMPFFLDVYGYVEKVKSFLGIPVDTKISMTTIADVNAILDELESRGITKVIVNYNYWNKNSFYDKIPTGAKVEGKVGTAAELKALKDRLESNGGKLYLSADLLNVYKTGNGVSQYSDVLKNVANTAQRQYQFSLSNGTVDSRYDAWYLLRPASLREFLPKYVSNLAQNGYTDVALASVGTMLYSELSSNGTGRSQVLRIMTEIMQQITQGSNLLVSGANEYVAAYATDIIRTASGTSGYDIEDVAVPFYQMVFHGFANYTLEASNLVSNPAEQTLRCIEFGACPIFSLVGENVDELIGSRLDSLFSADPANWYGFIGNQYAQISDALKYVLNAAITGHEIVEGTGRVVTYSNGTTIYVNYGKSEMICNNVNVPAGGYCVVQNGQVVCSAVAEGNL